MRNLFLLLERKIEERPGRGKHVGDGGGLDAVIDDVEEAGLPAGLGNGLRDLALVRLAGKAEAVQVDDGNLRRGCRARQRQRVRLLRCVTQARAITRTYSRCQVAVFSSQ